MVLCRVKGCQYSSTHVTVAHKCGKCGLFGHGKIECSNPEAIKVLGSYYMDKIPKNKKCKIGGCKYKDRHTTEGHVCHYCDKLGIKKFLFEPIAGDGFSASVSKGLSSAIAKSVSEKDPQMIAFLQDIIIVRNAYYLQQSGKAVTGGEAARNFFASIQPTDSSSVLFLKAQRAKQEIIDGKRDLENAFKGLAPQQVEQTNKPIANKTYSVGEIIERNEKNYKVTGISNPSDPDLEEVP